MKTFKDQPTNNLARQLRDEAFVDSPAFSPLLHARIMQQIRDEAATVSATSPASAPAPFGWRIGWRTLSSLAAVALLALTAWLYSHRQLKQPHIAQVTPTSIPQLTIQFPDLSEQANKSLSQAQFGYLDRDAKAAATYVINQFDIIPTAPSKRG